MTLHQLKKKKKTKTSCQAENRFKTNPIKRRRKENLLDKIIMHFVPIRFVVLTIALPIKNFDG